MSRYFLAFLLPALLLADFRYEQTTRVTKGMILRMPFAKKPEPTTTTHYFKGGRMATAAKDSVSIVDFDKQLFTTINHDKKQYWQMTFAEMQQMMEDMQAEMNKVSAKNQAAMQQAQGEMKFEAKATGTEKDVNGFVAKQVLMTVEFAAKAQQAGGQQMGASGGMKMVNDSWHSEAVPGYAEYKRQMERLQDKALWARGGNPFAAMANQPGMAQGMKKMAEEMAKVPGIPVLTISRVGMAGQGLDSSQMNGGTGGQAPSSAEIGEAAKQAGGEAAGSTAGRAIGGRLGGVLGGGLGRGLGGFGRKKQTEEPAAQAPAQSTPSAPTAPAASERTADGMMLMMETVTDASNFSAAPISEDVFAIPAGYAKVENETFKRRR